MGNSCIQSTRKSRRNTPRLVNYNNYIIKGQMGKSVWGCKTGVEIWSYFGDNLETSGVRERL